MGVRGTAGTELREQAIAWLVALDCGTADEQAFHTWRDADPRHASAFAQAAATWRRTADPRLPVLLDETIEPEPEPEPVPQRWSRRAFAASAVVAALGVGGAGAFLAWPKRAMAATAIGERRTLRLPDGSHATLNTDTRVAWRFAETREFWVERGEVALRIQPADKPLRLYSDPIEAMLGNGRFDMRLSDQGGELLAMEGSGVTRAGPLSAGSMLTVQGGTARIGALGPEALHAATAWQNGRILFSGMTLDRAIGEFNRYLPEKIVLAQADLARTQLGGEFLIDDPDSFLQSLRDGFDIDSRRDGNRILLFRRKR